MKQNIVKEKSFAFAVRIVKTYQHLVAKHKEFILSKQALRSGTAVGALIREAINAESKQDFIHKMALAQKECDETIYWLELMHTTSYLTKPEFESLQTDASEILKIIRSIIVTTKSKPAENHNS